MLARNYCEKLKVDLLVSNKISIEENLFNYLEENFNISRRFFIILKNDYIFDNGEIQDLVDNLAHILSMNDRKTGLDKDLLMQMSNETSRFKNCFWDLERSLYTFMSSGYKKPMSILRLSDVLNKNEYVWKLCDNDFQGFASGYLLALNNLETSNNRNV